MTRDELRHEGVTKLTLALDDNMLRLQHSILQHVADGHLDLEAALDAIDTIDHMLDGLEGRSAYEAALVVADLTSENIVITS